MTSTPRSVGPFGLLIIASNLETDHLGHDERTDAHPQDAAAAGDHQPFVDEEFLHIFAADEPDQHEHDEGQRADDIGRRLRFRRHGADLELHLGALAQHIGEVGERFGKVAAGFALDRDGDAEELEFGRAQPVGGFLKRLIERAADLHLVRDRAEFLAHRAIDLGADDAHRLGDRKAGPQVAHQQFDRVGEFGGELVDPLVDEHADHEVRQADADHQADEQRQQERHTLDRHRCGDDQRQAQCGETILADAPALARHLQPFAEQGRVGQEACRRLVHVGGARGRDLAHLRLDRARANDTGMAIAQRGQPPCTRFLCRRSGKGEDKQQQHHEGAPCEQHDRQHIHALLRLRTLSGPALRRPALLLLAGQLDRQAGKLAEQ
eukprot:Opistho-1_new@59007